jgi:nitrate reductase NapAB chaperone NapD
MILIKEKSMNLSSILVFTSPKNIEALNSRLRALPGIEVHYQCHETGRLVVIQEALDEKTEMAGLRLIKDLPQVMAAEMFYHYVDEGNVLPAAPENAEVLSWV